MPTISVVIPVYNAKKYLRRCVVSLLNQGYKDYEIILVDDGSNDGSEKICDEYANTYSFIRVKHQMNKGQACARNAGIEVAEGDFICFVDADDLVSANFLGELFNSATISGSDISVCSYCRLSEETIFFPVEEKKHSCVQCPEKDRFDVYNNIAAIKCIYHSNKKGMDWTPCWKLMKRSLFVDHDIRFPAVRMHEDIGMMFQPFYYAKKIVYTNSELYGYRITPESTMTRPINMNWVSAIDGTEAAVEFFRSKNEKELMTLAANFHLRYFFYVYDQFRHYHVANRTIMKEMRRHLRKDTKKYTDNCEFSLPRALAFRISATAPVWPFIKIVELRV